jgi:hypothetical protein
MSTLDKILITPEAVRTSRVWFDNQIQAAAKLRLTPNKVLLDKSFRLTGTLTPGKLYFFFYDAKLKETLPYWDQFPLVFPLSRENGAFRGLNMHYLEYKPRMALLQELLKVNGNKGFSERKKIQISWGLCQSMAKLAPAQACIKMYLNDHLASPFCEVAPEYWHTAMMLPVQRFVGASKEHVWADSKIKSRRK